MADALSFAGVRSESRFRAHINGTSYLFLDLLAPALLLGLWRAWSSVMAPKLGIYFTAEALLMAYAYFAVARMTHISAHSYDRTGCYSRALALRVGQEFYRGLRRYWPKIAIGVLALLLAALALDALTAGTGIQRRPNVHLTILFLEIMIWARYGAAVVIAAVRWSSLQPPDFARARDLAASYPVARSFALTNTAFALAAFVAVAGYKWGGALLPSARAELFSAAGVFVCLALLALWLQCRWARTILGPIEVRDPVIPAEHVSARAGT
jgi:hypothetical protein